MDAETLAGHRDEMIRRRVAGGANEAQSRAMLAEFLSTAGKGFLPTALHYNGFATARAAELFTEAYFADGPAGVSVDRGAAFEQPRQHGVEPLSSIRAGGDVDVVFSPAGKAVVEDLAAAMAATYDGSPESLTKLMGALTTADVNDLASDLSVVANDLLPVGEVARRRLHSEQARDLPAGAIPEGQPPSRSW